MNSRKTCAVVFRSTNGSRERVTVLAAEVALSPHFRSLDPWVSQLHLAGRAGTVLLLELATNRIVAKRDVGPGTTGAHWARTDPAA